MFLEGKSNDASIEMTDEARSVSTDNFSEIQNALTLLEFSTESVLPTPTFTPFGE